MSAPLPPTSARFRFPRSSPAPSSFPTTATHRNGEAACTLRDHGCWFLHLPPYSPDLIPIDPAFSKLKAHLRRIGARRYTDAFDAIGAICDLYVPQEYRNYVTAVGYVSG